MNLVKLKNTYEWKIIIFSLILLILGIVIDAVLPEWIDIYSLYTWLFLTLIMYGAHSLIRYGNKKSPADSPFYVMGAMATRIFLSFIAIVGYMYFIGNNKIAFLVNFFILYFAYTFFEIKTLLLSLQPHSKKQGC